MYINNLFQCLCILDEITYLYHVLKINIAHHL